MNTMTIMCHYKREEEYIPPRCRKPRYREATEVCPIHIPVVTPNEAPIAFKHKDHIVGVTPETGRFYSSTKVYRAFNGDLYTRIPASDKYCGAQGWWKLSQLKTEIMERQLWDYAKEWGVGNLHDVHECEAHFERMFAEYLIVDTGKEKQIWQKSGEPMYVIHTFGLGHNHGGTSYSITNHYNSNIGKDRYFNALQAKEGMKEALRIAKGRGDTDYLKYIRNFTKIQVLMPEMVKRNPKAEHGDGDPFMNQLEALTSGSSSAMEAGLLVMAFTGAEIARTK